MLPAIFQAFFELTPSRKLSRINPFGLPFMKCSDVRIGRIRSLNVDREPPRGWGRRGQIRKNLLHTWGRKILTLDF